MISLFVFAQLTNVTDRRTPGDGIIYRAYACMLLALSVLPVISHNEFHLNSVACYYKRDCVVYKLIIQAAVRAC